MLKVIDPSEKGIARFAIGSEDKPTSFIWRLWTNRDDAYLIFAPTHYLKFSMHGQVWKIDVGKHRHNFKPVPCSDAPGWIQGPAVMFCHVPYNPTPPPEWLLEQNRKTKNIRWFATPAAWHLGEFVVFFAAKELAEDQLPPRDGTVSSEQFAVGPLPLDDGRRIWLRHLTKPIPDDRKDYLLEVKGSLKGTGVDKTASELHSLGLVHHLHESTLVTIPFGLESIKTITDS